MPLEVDARRASSASIQPVAAAERWPDQKPHSSPNKINMPSEALGRVSSSTATGTVGDIARVDPRQGAAGIMEAHPLLDEGYSSSNACSKASSHRDKSVPRSVISRLVPNSGMISRSSMEGDFIGSQNNVVRRVCGMPRWIKVCSADIANVPIQVSVGDFLSVLLRNCWRQGSFLTWYP